MLQRNTTSILAGTVIACLVAAGCGAGSTANGDAKRSATEASGIPAVPGSPTPPEGTAQAPDSSAQPAPPSLDARRLLVQRDTGGSRNWDKDDPSTPAEPVFTARPECTTFTKSLFRVETSPNEAVAAWFDPRSINVTNSEQVVRVHPSPIEAQAAMTEMRRIVGSCRSWQEGPKPPGGWLFSASSWKVAGLSSDSLAWRVQVGVAGSPQIATASTWYITARYGNVVSTVSATSLDDVAAKARFDVRLYADQAQRLILKEQGH